MKIPESFPIQREEGYHTHHLGILESTIQFFGTIAVLHGKYWLLVYLFDEQGNHIDTKCQCSEIPFGLKFLSERRDELDKEINSMLKDIGSFVYSDILVKPFQVEVKIDGLKHTFGLIPLNERGAVILEPGNTIEFREPWDGTYDT